MTTSEILLLFQTIIALLALLVSVVHLRSQPFARIAPFLIFIIDSRARIVKHKDTKDKNGPLASAFSGCGGRPDIF